MRRNVSHRSYAPYGAYGAVALYVVRIWAYHE
jgi:hypothetical protein